MAKKTKAEEEYADLVIQSLVQEDYSVSKPVESAATSNESQDMEDKGDAQEADGAKVDKKSTFTEKNVAIATPQVPQNRKNKTKDIAVNKECIVKRDYEESFMRESGMTARKGKQVCIRSNFHDRIMKLTSPCTCKHGADHVLPTRAPSCLAPWPLLTSHGKLYSIALLGRCP